MSRFAHFATHEPPPDRPLVIALAFALGCVLLPLPATAPAAPAQTGAPPNFVFILIDDMGWADVGCFGSDFYQTPNVDRLAVLSKTFLGRFPRFCPNRNLPRESRYLLRRFPLSVV